MLCLYAQFGAKSCNIYNKNSFYVAKCMSINNLRSTTNFSRSCNPVCLQRIEKRLCLVFSGAHRQYINKMILMRKGIDIICVASGQKVLRYTDFSRIYKINADVYLLRHHPVLRKFLHIHPHISISSGYDLPQKKTFKWLF